MVFDSHSMTVLAYGGASARRALCPALRLACHGKRTTKLGRRVPLVIENARPCQYSAQQDSSRRLG